MVGPRLSELGVPYCGSGPGPQEWLTRWNFDPALLLAFAVAIGAWHLTGGFGDRRRSQTFVGSLIALAVLFISPLCPLTSALFAARAAHHAVLIAVAAPLLAWALPDQRRVTQGPLAAWVAAQAVVLWAWHYPPLYSAALRSDLVYWLMQGSLLGAATGFWVSVRRATIAGAVAGLLATMVQMGLLGALITFASAPLYAPHLLTTAPWGLSPLEDQQMAGLIMWAPAAAIYLAAALLMAGRWLRQESRLPA